MFHRSRLQNYISIIDKNMEYLSSDDKKLFDEFNNDHFNYTLGRIGDRTYEGIHNDIKYYKEKNKWIFCNFQEIPYFKMKLRNKSLKKLGI